MADDRRGQAGGRGRPPCSINDHEVGRSPLYRREPVPWRSVKFGRECAAHRALGVGLVAILDPDAAIALKVPTKETPAFLGIDNVGVFEAAQPIPEHRPVIDRHAGMAPEDGLPVEHAGEHRSRLWRGGRIGVFPSPGGRSGGVKGR